MILNQDNLDRHAALYLLLPDGTMVGVEPCESEGDIEMPLYHNAGTEARPEWEPTPSQTYGNSPYETLEALLADNPGIARRSDWKRVGEVEFH